MRYRKPEYYLFLVAAVFIFSLPSCSSPSLENTTGESPSTVNPTTSVPTPEAQVITPANATATAPSSGACPATQEVEVDEDAILEMGPGPGIPASKALGERLVISGTVYAQDCSPLPGATLEVWQTDANGEYGPGHGTNNMNCCYLMGSVTTDSQGRYQLLTSMPAHYKGETVPPPAHIHVRVIHPDAGEHETEIVFEDDPYLPQNLQNFIVVSLKPAAENSSNEAGLQGVADIILD